MKRTFGSLEVEIVRGDIANQPDMEAVVNAANAELMPGGGVAGAIHRAAGPGLAEECRPLAPIRPGQAVITSAHNLPSRHVIHALGPVYGHDEPADELLADCYKNSIRLAEENGLSSVAFPAISTGAFGYPLEEAAEVALGAVAKELESLSNIRKIRKVRFVLFSDREFGIHEKALERIR